MCQNQLRVLHRGPNNARAGSVSRSSSTALTSTASNTRHRTRTAAEELADFATRDHDAELAEPTSLQLRIRVLDALGCAIGAIGGDPVERVRSYVRTHGAGGTCRMIGGGTSGPRAAALLNGSLVRYLDFNDSYIAPGETCHPSDNLAAILAAADVAEAEGNDLLLALGTAYQVQCRLSDEAPVRDRGFDHTSQLVIGTAAGVSRALALDATHAANAIAIAGTALHSLRVTRTGSLSEWKGLAAPFAAASALEATLLAAEGITGPLELFEAKKGFIDALSGPFEIDWSRERLDRVLRTDVKRYNAEAHSQSAIDVILRMRRRERFDAKDIDQVDVEIFQVAYDIIGGGAEGAKTQIRTKEQADHSLPYILAAALLDGEVGPAQYTSERIQRTDIQQLLNRVHTRPSDELSARFPREMPCRITIRLRDGRSIVGEGADFPGFHSRPLDWPTALEKFTRLAGSRTTPALCDQIADTVHDLESRRAHDLSKLLGEIAWSSTTHAATDA
jgi:2-methylcitrate dehydratase